MCEMAFGEQCADGDSQLPGEHQIWTRDAQNLEFGTLARSISSRSQLRMKGKSQEGGRKERHGGTGRREEDCRARKKQQEENWH